MSQLCRSLILTAGKISLGLPTIIVGAYIIECELGSCYGSEGGVWMKLFINGQRQSKISAKSPSLEGCDN